MSADLIFLRPWWLVVLLLLPAIIFLQRSRKSNRDVWQRAVDPHLLPHLIEARPAARGAAGSWLLPTGVLMAIVALAGPSWQQQKTPLWQVEAPLVIALDLSSAMLAADLPPSRLVQARFKLMELLRKRRGGQVGLIVYAGDAFTAAPITRDSGTVQAVIDSLAADLMPVDGQRADRAIDSAVALMRSAGFSSGDILLVTDHSDRSASKAAGRVRAQGFRVSALGVGTAAGAPKTGASGFVSNARGQVEFARLDLASLKALAAQGGGTAATLSADGRDLEALGLLDPQTAAPPANAADGATSSSGAEALRRTDDGYWLLLPLLALALLGFRRQALLTLPLLLMLGTGLQSGPVQAAIATSEPGPPPASAPSPSTAFWAALWQRPDQRARAALDTGDFKLAGEVSPDAAVRGAAAYRGKDYAAAAQEFASGDSADARYNLGNALAEAGQYEKALAAYDQALARQPGMTDAQANRKAVEDALKNKRKQPPPAQDQPKDSPPTKPNDSSSPSQQGQSQQTQENPSPSTPDEKPPQGKPADAPAKSATQPSGEQSGRDQQPDSTAQQAADAAAKQEMQKALAQQKGGKEDGKPGKAAATASPEQRARAEHEQALQQWLRQVPDDPGGLLRRKFALEYQRRQAKGDE